MTPLLVSISLIGRNQPQVGESHSHINVYIETFSQVLIRVYDITVDNPPILCCPLYDD
jgi:hypothetical protein